MSRITGDVMAKMTAGIGAMVSVFLSTNLSIFFFVHPVSLSVVFSYFRPSCRLLLLLFASPCVCPSFHLPVCLCVCLSACLFICLSVCLSLFVHPFYHLSDCLPFFFCSFHPFLHLRYLLSNLRLQIYFDRFFYFNRT